MPRKDLSDLDLDPEVVIQCIDGTWHAWRFYDGHMFDVYARTDYDAAVELTEILTDYEEKKLDGE